ncbi:MAG: hypothetical protein KBC84_06940, partial [Proteobacteria bacterium]|nr:hypothetical protein [Pseudomonadota bacterium]
MKRASLLLILKQLLRPAVRFSLRFGFHIQDILEAAKQAFLEEAALSLKNTGREANISQLSAITGLHRRDVMRIFRDGDTINEPQGLINRIIGQWLFDKRFNLSAGKARPLATTKENNEFAKLVNTVSNDLNPGTILNELLRLNIVEKKKNRLLLLSSTFDTKKEVNLSYHTLTRELDNLYLTVEENLYDSTKIPNLHGTTEFDKINLENLPQIKKWFFEEGSKSHKKAR